MSKLMGRFVRQAWLGTIFALVLGFGGAASSAQAAPSDPLFIFSASQGAGPDGGFEGPCGVAVDSKGQFYVADYYHRAIDLFTSNRGYVAPQIAGEDPLTGPCGLALNSEDRLYVNNYHRSVTSEGTVIDTSEPTGIAVDRSSGTVYVNDRTHIGVYDSFGAPVEVGGTPYRIAANSLQDGYGLAISEFPSTAGRLYVPDAGTDTVKVYDPATDTEDPIEAIDAHATPAGGFHSLRDAAIAVDRVSGIVYVADNLQPVYAEHPEATIYAFSPTGAYLGHLKYNIVDALPPGLAVDNSQAATQGRVYVTSGNTEKASLYAYGPGAATMSAPLCAPGGSCPASAPPPAPEASTSGAHAAAVAGQGSPPAPASTSEVAQKGTLRVSVSGKLSPRSLPRGGKAPIAVSVGGQIATTDESAPPQLETLRIEINRHGRLDYTGLPTCPYDQIQPASSARALAACRPALVGEGSFTANIILSGQVPYATRGRLLVFNGKSHGKPVLFGQIYSPHPFATSFVIVFGVRKLTRGTYGTALVTSLPKALGSWGNLTGIEMTLSRHYSYQGEAHSYLSADCPAPKGFGKAVFPLARTSFGFEGGQSLSSTLTRSCKVR